MAQVTLRNVEKSFGPTRALRDFSVDIRDGELLTFLGPSGCGKTTSLRSVAGFVMPEKGRIRIGTNDVFDHRHGTWIPPERRGIGMVFQSYALWPHMRVDANVAYPLKIHKVPRSERRVRVGEVLDLVKMSGLGRRYPHELSGGQQQRVALARAMISNPDVLLLDEPLSNLDAKLREQMRLEIKELQRQTDQTVIFVTHDQLEAMELSDRIVVMREGEIQQIGEPAEIYGSPTSQFVARFIGAANFLPCRASADGLHLKDAPGLKLPFKPPESSSVQDYDLMIRPEAITLSPGTTGLFGQVTQRLFKGDSTEYVVDVEGIELRVKTNRAVQFAIGEDVSLCFDEVKFFERFPSPHPAGEQN